MAAVRIREDGHTACHGFESGIRHPFVRRGEYEQIHRPVSIRRFREKPRQVDSIARSAFGDSRFHRSFPWSSAADDQQMMIHLIPCDSIECGDE
jgi:hypothetical protein